MNREQLEAFRLQFITHFNDRFGYYESAQQALLGGCRWIQLRMKDSSEEDVEAMALKIQPLCKEYGAMFIIDDYVSVCQNIKADGVHLGKNDISPIDARNILGDKFIIGGTCNTFEDIEAIKDSVDYVGCGPFRFTNTKKNLSPILGLDGYKSIVWKCRESGIDLPIVAIGGIELTDIKDIIEAEPNGIAMSGTILNAQNPAEETEVIVNEIDKCFKAFGI